MKKLLITFLLISSLLVGCGSTQTSGDANEMAADEEENKEIAFVKVSPVVTMDFLNTLSVPGTLQPKDEIFVTPRIGGTIEGVFVEVGSKVQQGNMLAKIDDTVLQLQYEKAKTAMALEQLKVEKIAQALELEKIKIQNVEKGIEIAEMKLANLEKNYQRTKALYESHAVPKVELENIENQYLIEKEALTLSKNEHAMVVGSLALQQKDYEMAVGVIELLRNDYLMAKQNLDYTVISAPVSGTVSMKDVSIGETIGQGKPIFGLVNTRELYVVAGVTERVVPLLRVGQEVNIRINSVEGSTTEGTISHIAPLMEQQSKTYPIQVRILNNDDVLKDGMFATIEIILDAQSNALGIEKEAIIQENGKQFVFVEDNGKAVKKEVMLGFANDTHREITSGLQLGEKIIIVGHNSIIDGSEVKIR